MSQIRNYISAYEESKKHVIATFEEAIVLTEIGKFQIRALMCSGLSLFAVLVETSAVSYLLPAAECELDLSLKEKGMLGSAVFIGFASSALLWGAVGDVWGRRNTMMTTLFLCGLSTLFSSLAPSFLPLLIFRFFSGFFSCAASGLLYVYAGEFYNNAKRPRAVVVAASLGAGGVCFLPSLAWLIIPQAWTISIPGVPFLISSWRMFLGMCSIPSFSAAFVLCFCLPESPKFLLSKGRNKEALEVCKAIFQVNTGKPKSEYPVHSIELDESENPQAGKARSILHTCWNQTAPLFGRSLLGTTLLISLLQAASFFGFTALIMWLPEMFNRLSARPPGTATICDVMSPAVTEVNLLDEVLETVGEIFPIEEPSYNTTASHTCDPTIEDHVFLYALCLTLSGWCGNMLSGILINLLGKRNLFVSMTMVSACLVATLPYIKHPVLLLVLYCSCLGFAGAGPGIVAAASMDLFPTHLRGMATCMSMMAGRIGAVFSTMVFGILLDVRCELPFFILCIVLTGGVLLGTRLPKS